MPDLPTLDEILDLAKELHAELPKSRQGVKAAGRRARKILVKIRPLCPEVRRELRDLVVYPLEEPQVAESVKDLEEKAVDLHEAKQPPKKRVLINEQPGRYIDVSND